MAPSVGGAEAAVGVDVAGVAAAGVAAAGVTGAELVGGAVAVLGPSGVVDFAVAAGAALVAGAAVEVGAALAAGAALAGAFAGCANAGRTPARAAVAANQKANTERFIFPRVGVANV